MTNEPMRCGPGLPRSRARLWRSACIVGFAWLCGACATYEANPLDPEHELASLRMRTLESLRIEAAQPGASQPAAGAFDASDGLDEAELVAVALTANPALRAKRAELGEASALLVTAGIWPNPELGLSIRPGLGSNTTTGVGLELLFALLRPDERDATRAVAEAQLDTTRAEVAAEELRLAAEVRRARLGVLAAAHTLRLFEQELAMRDEAVALVGRKRELGEGTELDLVLVELDRTGVQHLAREAQTSYERESRHLNLLVGIPPEHELPLTGLHDPLTFTLHEDLSEQELDRRLLAGRFDLRARTLAYERAEAELRLAIARQYPRLGIGPSYEKDVEGSEGLGVGAVLELPLFDRNQGGIAEKTAARERTRAEFVAALHEARAGAFEAAAALRRARAEVELQRRDVEPLVERAETLFEGALRAGELTIFEWLTVRGRAVQARRDLLDALVRHAGAVVELEYATGMPLTAAVPETDAERTPRDDDDGNG